MIAPCYDASLWVSSLALVLLSTYPSPIGSIMGVRLEETACDRLEGDLDQLLDQFQDCIHKLDTLREETLQIGETSVELNQKAYSQYKAVVDNANEMDLDTTLETAMADQRDAETKELKQTMGQLQEKRRALWSPLWQSTGLWPGYEPDPRRAFESQHLPYIGGSAKPESTLQALKEELDPDARERVDLLENHDSQLHHRIDELEQKLGDSSLSANESGMGVEQRLELATLNEVEHAREEHRHT